jgi:hypothetical protein
MKPAAFSTIRLFSFLAVSAVAFLVLGSAPSDAAEPQPIKLNMTVLSAEFFDPEGEVLRKGGNAPAGTAPALVAASAQQPDLNADTNKATLPHAGLGDRLRIRVAGMEQAAKDENFGPTSLILYLNNQPMPGIQATVADPGTTAAPDQQVLEFNLQRMEANEDAWRALLGKPTGSSRPTFASVGLPDGRQAMPSGGAYPRFMLDLYSPAWMVGTMAALATGLVLFLWMVRTSNIVRDAGPPIVPLPARRPFSLARVQMAAWFFTVVAAFMFIFVVTGDYGTLTAGTLGLIGISAVTGLSARAIDDQKYETIQAELARLHIERAELDADHKGVEMEVSRLLAERDAKKTIATQAQAANAPNAAQAEQESQFALEAHASMVKTEAGKKQKLDDIDRQIRDATTFLSSPVSVNFIHDILTDANGISFHRFQILIWTIVLIIIFIKGVYESLSMPEFDSLLLGLMGISSGTYLGFKIPERQQAPPPS